MGWVHNPSGLKHSIKKRLYKILFNLMIYMQRLCFVIRFTHTFSYTGVLKIMNSPYVNTNTTSPYFQILIIN